MKNGFFSKNSNDTQAFHNRILYNLLPWEITFFETTYKNGNDKD